MHPLPPYLRLPHLRSPLFDLHLARFDFLPRLHRRNILVRSSPGGCLSCGTCSMCALRVPSLYAQFNERIQRFSPIATDRYQSI